MTIRVVWDYFLPEWKGLISWPCVKRSFQFLKKKEPYY
jgi:hypothetical protein